MTIKILSFVKPVPYTVFLRIQESLLKSKLPLIPKNGRLVSNDTINLTDYVLVLEHPPVYTFGRKTQIVSNLPAPSYKVDRGGEATFHGPGQILFYPIIDLKNYKRDLRWYVNILEQTIVVTLKQLGIKSFPKSVGVWTDEFSKIGFIGFQNTRWISSHGLSLNYNVDPSWFSHIEPCGYKNIEVINIRDFSSSASIEEVRSKLIENFSTLKNNRKLL